MLNRLIGFGGTLCVCFLIANIFSTELSAVDFHRNYKSNRILIETYVGSPDELIPVFGFQYDKEILFPFYYLLTIKGVIGGNDRAGYGMAGYGLGAKLPVIKGMYWDSSVVAGSGGGGHFDVKGGFLYQIQSGLIYQLDSIWAIASHLSYLSYPTGAYKTPVITFGLLNQSIKDVEKLDKKSIQKELSHLTIEVKTYKYVEGENILQYGGKYKTFITDTFYWGQAGYGAIGGNRSGYIEGGVLFGKLFPVNDNFYVDLNTFIGAAGGGVSSTEGGGFLFQPYVGIGTSFDKWLLQAQVGWEYFVNGEISELCWGFSFGRKFNSVY